MAAIRWQPWGAAPFARARAEGRPVLLSIVASWCRHSRRMDRVSYARDEVAAVVADRFVPVRVDADRRPDVAARYGLGGLPTTVFLTPDGEVIGGGTYVEGSRFADILARVSSAFAAGEHRRPTGVPPAPARPPAPGPGLDGLVAALRASFDGRHGGFGAGPKFPHAAPVSLALLLHQESPSDGWGAMAERTLDAIGWGPLHDEADGGFFRAARGADWSAPDGEKLLDVNAALLQLYVEAHATLGYPRYAARAEDVLRYLQNLLADPVDGGWAASQRARQDGDAADAAPVIDRTQYADWNAMTISAALRAGGAMGDRALSEFALRSLEHLVLRCYRPGEGMAHYAEAAVRPGLAAPAPVRGLLDDQILMAAAHLDAFEATGNVVFEMMAEELALYAIRTMWDGRAGAFLDRAPAAGDIGRLREPRLPFAMNAVAARLLRRLTAVSEKPEFARYSTLIVAALAPDAASQGPLAAEYVLAAREAGER